MERKTIAVFISALYEDMVRQTVDGFLRAAEGENVKILFFTSFADNHTSRNYERYKDYDTGDFTVYLLPDLREFDALVSFDTYMTGTLIEPIDRLKEAAPCPVITLGTVKDHTWSIVNDQILSFSEVIRHLADRHGCRDFAYVSGQKERSFCIERIEIFRNVMKEYGLPGGEDRIYYGTLRPECGDEIVGQMIERRKQAGMREVPDAVVCVNDYTAIGIISALEKRGWSVPGDVLVTGYDDIMRAQFNEPSLTTSAQPFRLIGETGMKKTLQILRGEKVDPVTAVPGTLCLRQSCGCEPPDTYRKDTIRDRYIQTVSNLEALALSNTDMILGGAQDLTEDELFQEIEEASLRETGFQSAVLCMMRSWRDNKQIRDREDLENEIFDVVCGRWNGERIRPQRLPRGQLLPVEMMEDGKPCYIYPIHHLQYFLGYFIVDPVLYGMEQLHVKSWLVSVSTVLVNWFIRRRLTETVSELDVLYQTDMLTGLYNRYGYYRFFESYYEECRAAGTGLAVFLIDMNRMKEVNDRYGHAEGDFCLRTIADAMKKAAGEDEICIRTGGDEFVVLARHYDLRKEETYTKLVREYISETLEREGKHYRFTVSIGCCRRVPPKAGVASIRSEAELFLGDADRSMYEEKQEYHRIPFG